MGNSFIIWFSRWYKGIILALGAFGVAMLVVLAMQHVSASNSAAGAQAGPIPTFTSRPEQEAPDRVQVARGTRALIFGDSWTVGYFANPLGHGYAYLTGDTMKWDTTVNGVAGTGYTNPGPDDEGAYADRIAELPDDLNPELVVLQGSVNDIGASGTDLRAAVASAIDAMTNKYPDADVVLFGPAAVESPASDGVKLVDNTLRTVATERRLNYISPISEQWFTAGNLAEMVDPAKANHPTTAGHELLAQRLAVDLREIGR